MVCSLFNIFLINIIKIYQYVLSPFLRNRCRFFPSCSNYGIEALLIFGTFKGVWLILKRLIKCHPMNYGKWYDPVPLKKEQP